MLGTVLAAAWSPEQWTTLIVIGTAAVGGAIVQIINAIRLSAVKATVDGSAHLLAANNAATVAALTGTIQTQATAAAPPPEA